MATNLAAAAITATGTNTKRTYGDRWGDIINVKDFGALGNGSHDDSGNIQDAFDAAFGTSGSPHGLAGCLTNKPVFFPAGYYPIGTTLNLTRVVGGRIFGAGNNTVKLTKASGTILNINGAANLVVEGMNLDGGWDTVGATTTICVNLDWDNTSGGDGLHSNTFRDMLISNCDKGIVIADQSHGGAANNFVQCEMSECKTVGIEAKGTAALGQTVVLGGAIFCAAGYKASGGSFGYLGGQANAANTYDYVISTNYATAIVGGRSEGHCLNMSTGVVAMRGFMQNPPSTKVFANITGGICSIDGCRGGDSTITGNGGSLYLRGNMFPAGYRSGYSGTVVQHLDD